MRGLFRYLRPYWYLALLAPLAMVGEVVCDLLQPTMMSKIVDDGVAQSNVSLIWSYGWRMLAIVLLGCLCGFLSSVFANMAAMRFSYDLRRDTYERVMALSISQTDRFTTGSLVTRLTNDITMVQNFVAMLLRMFVRSPLTFLGGIFMAIQLHVSFSLVLLVALPIQLFLIFYILRKASPLFSQVQSKLDTVNSVVQENVTGARVVKAYGKEEHEIARFACANAELKDVSYRVQTLMARLSPILMIVMNASVIAVIYIGNLQVQAGALHVGKIMAAVTYVTQILMSFMMIGTMFQSISRANASARRIEEILHTASDIENGAITETGKEGSVCMKDVSFRYPNTTGAPVLHDVSFEIAGGEYVAILGATGVGKTSLVSLITRFYDCNEGAVYVDGVDVRDYDLSVLRQKIAYVLQKSELFSGSIEENIRFGNIEAPFAAVRHAAEIAQADDFISRQEQGYQTPVTEKGTSLSGGQKQRIAIARAILRRPEIMIFDDSTSALDLHTEAKLRSALRAELKDTTVIMIAQRIASVMQADKIIVLDEGTVSAVGTHAQLMQSSALYRDIYESQLGKEERAYV